MLGPVPIQRDPVSTKLPGGASTLPPASKTHTAPADAAAFMKATFTEAVFRPTSGGAAQFFVQYTPTTETLLIGVKVRADFKHSASLGGTTATPEAGVDGYHALLIGDINAKPEPQRAGLVDTWRWQSGENLPFARDLQKVVTDTWSSAATNLSFVLDKPSWPAAKARVVINIEVDDGAGTQLAPGPTVAAADRHLDLTIWKRPQNLKTDSREEQGSKDNVHASMTLSSNSVRGRADNGLVYDWDPSGIAADLGNLKGWASDARSARTALGGSANVAGKVPDAAGEPLKVEIHGSDAKQRNQDAIDVIKAVVDGCGDATRVQRAPDQPNLPRGARVTLGNGQAQSVAAHEFGHLFGLPDEYPGSSFRPTGTAADDDKQAAAMGPNGPKGALVENNDNIMSQGSVVRAQHYSMFLDALRKVTGLTEWRLP